MTTNPPSAPTFPRAGHGRYVKVTWSQPARLTWAKMIPSLIFLWIVLAIGLNERLQQNAILGDLLIGTSLIGQTVTLIVARKTKSEEPAYIRIHRRDQLVRYGGRTLLKDSTD